MALANEARERSGEEDDNLARSTKKVKAAEPVVVESGQATPIGDGDQQPFPRLSFRDAALGSQNRGMYDELGSLESDEGLIHVSTHGGWPKISLSERFKSHIRRQWERCIIVKLLGRSVSFRVLNEKIHKMWNPKGEMSLVDLGMGYFLVRFASTDDLAFAMEEGPWTIFGHYLTVRPWVPDFNPSTATIDSTMVWVRFPGLPMEYYHPRLLMALGNTVGKAVSAYINTRHASRGRFARVCVEVNFNDPLVPKVFFEDRWLSVEYEGLPMICFKCGRQGHKGICPYFPHEDDESEKQNVEGGVAMAEDNVQVQHKQVNEHAALSPGDDMNERVDIELEQVRENVVEAWAKGVGMGSNMPHDGAKRAQVNYKAQFRSKAHGAVTTNAAPQGARVHQVASSSKNTNEDLSVDNRGKQARGVEDRLDVNLRSGGVERCVGMERNEVSAFQSSKSALGMQDTDISRGAGGKAFLRHAKDLLRAQKPTCFVLVEPRISGNNARRVVRRLGFSKFHIADPVGYAGGIWMCWDNGAVDIEIISSSPQVIHSIVRRPNAVEFLLTAVYASPVLETRRNLWKSLEAFAENVSLPWVVVGDFNDVLHSGEKYGGNQPSLGRCNAFNSMITYCGLIDLGFKGPSFTWCNKRNGVARIQKRLDRVFSNAEWRLLFPEAEVRHLPRLHSDHCPVLLQCDPGFPLNNSNRPFRFQAMWLMVDGFYDLIGKFWAHSHGDIEDKLANVAELLREWNKESFGNIFERKKELRARICGVQRALAAYRSHQLELLEDNLVREYNAFSSGAFNEHLSRTLLVLIPKVANPEYTKQFRPISLCTVTYKLITKVLVNRLRPHLATLVAPFQSSFIPKRQAADDIFIAQEMIHSIKKTKSKNGLMAIKIDLEKAYDRSLLASGNRSPWDEVDRPFLICFFADDLFLFGRATVAQVNVIKAVLDTFCMSSGAKMSLDKSYMFISPHASTCNARLVSRCLGIRLSSNLGKYLGIPLINGRVVKGTYRELVDKVSSRLSGWKTKCLSLADRATLVASVTSVIPTCTMLTTKLPQNVCTQMDMLNRRFLWGGSESKRALHLVNWETVCTPKKLGGLGLRQMELHNSVLLQKLYGDFLQNLIVCGFNWSHTWRSMIGALRVLSKGLVKRIGDGSLTRFWVDKWLDKPIVEYLESVPSFVDGSTMVSDFIVDKAWNVNMVFAQVPLQVAMKIMGYPLSRFGILTDTYIWEPCSNGSFTTASAYQLMLHEMNVLEQDLRWLWRLALPARWIYLLWLVWKGRLVTNSFRASWGVGIAASCPLSEYPVEDVIHVLRDCSYPVTIWKQLVPSQNWSSFYGWDLTEWLLNNLDIKKGEARSVTIFATVLWRIWTQRCNYIFEPDDSSVSEQDMIRNICFTSREILEAWSKPPSAVSVPKMIHWCPPPALKVKVNTDGASRGNSGVAGAGGVIRDAGGSWLDEGFREVICEVDAMVILELPKSANVSLHPLGALIIDIREILARNWDCIYQHTLREGNFCADLMSKMGCELDNDFQIFCSPPESVLDVLGADARGVAFPRGFNVT
ncbi:reverse transcriptase [Corchorus capsularis]|uniref:Reverse transcriptase n=1 Tax=Corchorus capsularis TaxID=210143 RepID=A0A1R3K2D5_COCAP|nr:reverse transcriptase [Corchorus capsularis]